MTRDDLTDYEWQQPEPLPPPQRTERKGNPYRGHRTVINGINGIPWVLRTGAPWRNITAAMALRGPAQPDPAAGHGRGYGRERFRPCMPLMEATSKPTRMRRWAKKGASREESQKRQALGRSGGRLTSELLALCDRCYRSPAVVTIGGCGDTTMTLPTLDAVRVPWQRRGYPCERPARVLGDEGHSYPSCRCHTRRRSVRMVIPERRDQRLRKWRKGCRPCRFGRELCKECNVIERTVLRLKQSRRVTTRYDKTRASYQAFVTLASIRLWLR